MKYFLIYKISIKNIFDYFITFCKYRAWILTPQAPYHLTDEFPPCS